MAKFKLYMPGERPLTSPTFIVYRGKEQGQWVEKSTGCVKARDARAWVAERHAALAAGTLAPMVKRPARPELKVGRRPVDYQPRPGRTYGEAIEAYAEHMKIELGFGLNAEQRQNSKRLVQLRDVLGCRPIEEVGEVELHQAADQLKPGNSNESKNREVIGPGRAARNYASDTLRWCSPLKIRSLREKKPALRALATEDVVTILDAAEPGEQRLLLQWCYFTGMRIEDTLQRVLWWDPRKPGAKVGIDLRAKTVSLRIGKTDEPETFDLMPELVAALQQIPMARRHDRLFRWGSQSNVNRWLHPLRDRVGIFFTPHMLRHSFGAMLADLGTPLSDIMQRLGHKSITSAVRYTRAVNKQRQQRTTEQLTSHIAAVRRTLKDEADGASG